MELSPRHDVKSGDGPSMSRPEGEFDAWTVHLHAVVDEDREDIEDESEQQDVCCVVLEAKRAEY